jgi:hypothetical protein
MRVISPVTLAAAGAALALVTSPAVGQERQVVRVPRVKFEVQH